MARYHFYKTGNTIICVSSYAGKTVRGVAKCAPNDTFDEDFGRRLAQARCDYKVALKRYGRADKKFLEALVTYEKAWEHKEQMGDYLDDAENALEEAYATLLDLENGSN